jgi:anti-sigma B factor antagonist/stage II sporulation protein AA (anti-sigma F factor antagonist)
MEGLRFTVRHQGATAVLAFDGEIDIAERAVLDAATQSLSEDATAVCVDLSAVSFLDSTGVHFLVALRRRCVARGAGFGLSGVQSQPLRVITVCGLRDYLGLGPRAATR